jgi:secreted Zn-dependent insulinase-like peptidase
MPLLQIDLGWALPPLTKEYRKKPLHYLSWVIGHEGKGSLISYLRKKVRIDIFFLNRTVSCVRFRVRVTV